MARSLTIVKDETPTTTPLFTAFLLVAVGLLLIGMLAAGTEASATAPSAGISQE